MENKMTTVNFEDIKLNDEERQPCEVWTRVMGYLRPYSEFNVGKKSEFRSRVNFSRKPPSFRKSSYFLLI